MAIRKSKEENYSVNGTLDEWMRKCEQALNNGGFTKITSNKLINQLTANYKKFTVWGEIIITLVEENSKVKIQVSSTANVDNLFALINSPNQKIIDQFKNNLK